MSALTVSVASLQVRELTLGAHPECGWLDCGWSRHIPCGHATCPFDGGRPDFASWRAARRHEVAERLREAVDL